MNWAPLWLSLQVAVISTILSGLIALIIAAITPRQSSIFKDLLESIIAIPLVLPPTVLGYYLLVLLGRQSILGKTYETLTGSSIVFTVTGAVVAAIVGAIPLTVRGALVAVAQVPDVYRRAARTLGANRWRVFFSVELPLARNGIVAGLLLGFARSMGDFGMTLMVAGDIPDRTQTASLALYDAWQSGNSQQALWLSVVMTSVAVLLMYVANRFGKGSER